MESKTAYAMLSTLTESGAFNRKQAENLIKATDIANSTLATKGDIAKLKRHLKLRLANQELRTVAQIYAAAGLLFAALKAFG